MIVYFLVSLLLASSQSWGMDETLDFGYKSTAQYKSYIEKLRQSPHPWAQSFLTNLEAVHKENRDDVQKLCKAIGIADDIDQDTLISKVRQRFQDDERSCKKLLSSLEEKYKSSDCWPLFTGLKKLIGTDDVPGILADSSDFLRQNPNIVEGISPGPLFDNEITAAKTACLYILLEKNDQNAIDDEEIVKELRIVEPNPIFKDPSIRTAAEPIRLFDSKSNILFKPSASYEFGANPKGRHVWDCSSFVGLVIDCPLRFSTKLLEEASQHFHGFTQNVSFEIKEILKFMDALPSSQINHKHLQFMDILIWRSAGGGHVAFYLGEGNSDQAVIGDSNRDDKTVEGTGISERPLFKSGTQTFGFRMRETRK